MDESSEKRMAVCEHQRALQCHRYGRCESEAARKGRVYLETTLLSEADLKREIGMTAAFTPPTNMRKEMPTTPKATLGRFQLRLSQHLKGTCSDSQHC